MIAVLIAGSVAMVLSLVGTRWLIGFFEVIGKAMDALAKAELNGRDFYVQGPAAYSQARAERDAAFAKLRAAHDYVGEMLAGICDQKR